MWHGTELDNETTTINNIRWGGCATCMECINNNVYACKVRCRCWGWSWKINQRRKCQLCWWTNVHKNTSINGQNWPWHSRECGKLKVMIGWWPRAGVGNNTSQQHHSTVRGGRSTEINNLETLNDDNPMWYVYAKCWSCVWVVFQCFTLKITLLVWKTSHRNTRVPIRVLYLSNCMVWYMYIIITTWNNHSNNKSMINWLASLK